MRIIELTAEELRDIVDVDDGGLCLSCDRVPVLAVSMFGDARQKKARALALRKQRGKIQGSQREIVDPPKMQRLKGRP